MSKAVSNNQAEEKEKKEVRFTKPWKNSDVVLVVEEKEIHVHSSFLSLVSPVFEAMFNGNFKEAQTRKVTLEGKSYDNVLYMLRMVYPFENIFFGKTKFIFRWSDWF